MLLPTVRERSQGVWVATWSNVCISLVRDQLTGRDVTAARRVYETVAADNKTGFISVIVAQPDVGMPSDEARKAIPDLMKGLENRVLAMVGILEASGFKAAAVRTIMATMAMVSRTTYPRKIFATVDEAVPFITNYVKPSGTFEQVKDAILQVKRMGGEA